MLPCRQSAPHPAAYGSALPLQGALHNNRRLHKKSGGCTKPRFRMRLASHSSVGDTRSFGFPHSGEIVSVIVVRSHEWAFVLKSA